ncbi:hypothetical protein ACFL5Q_00040 [Planctomycetota bacterium]
MVELNNENWVYSKAANSPEICSRPGVGLTLTEARPTLLGASNNKERSLVTRTSRR